MENQKNNIQPAIMADEWESLISQIDAVSTFAKNIQIDVMDGKLVPSKSFPYNETTIEGKRLPEGIEFEAHLMVENPREVGLSFIRAGASRIVAQIEGMDDPEETFIQWNEVGAKTGVSILLSTPIEEIYSLIEEEMVSSVQIMTIQKIGYQGEKFDESSLERIRDLKEKYPNLLITVDGGVNAQNIVKLRESGAAIFGVGSAIMKEEDKEGAFSKLSNVIE
ncbi:hypothetical protein COB52_03395 [Candidatus Kaiserbacteria bacterium]|nr:MAG: hypothetical protein COB52_03395 [Candidatus Kaiserbacteria bacterium]